MGRGVFFTALAGALALAVAAGAAVADDQGRQVTLVNDLGRRLMVFRIAPSSSNIYPEDALGEAVVEPGGSVTIFTNDSAASTTPPRRWLTRRG